MLFWREYLAPPPVKESAEYTACVATIARAGQVNATYRERLAQTEEVLAEMERKRKK